MKQQNKLMTIGIKTTTFLSWLQILWQKSAVVVEVHFCFRFSEMDTLYGRWLHTDYILLHNDIWYCP